MTSPIRRAGVVALAAVAAEAVYLLAHHAFNVDLVVPGRAVGALAVGTTALLAGLAGWALLAILERLTRRGRTVWRVIAAVVLLISLLGPLGATAAGAVGTLVALHLAVGGVLLAGLPR